MLYFILTELFLLLGAFLHCYYEDICATLLEYNKKLIIGYFCDFVITELEEKENLL